MHDFDCKRVEVSTGPYNRAICEFDDDCPIESLRASGCGKVADYDVGRLTGPRRTSPIERMSDADPNEEWLARFLRDVDSGAD